MKIADLLWKTPEGNLYRVEACSTWDVNSLENCFVKMYNRPFKDCVRYCISNVNCLTNNR